MRAAGGHVLDYVLGEGQIEIAAQHGFHLKLPQTEEFEGADLSDPASAQIIQKAEG